MTKVTVVIPFSQEHPDHLRIAVRSVFAQTEVAWKLLLVGDAPRRDLVGELEEIDDRRVTVKVGSVRRGLAHRLNQSIDLVDTEFYARMDADDVMRPERIARQLALLSSDTSLDVVGSRVVVIDEHDRVGGVLHESRSAPSSIDELARANVFSHPSVMARTSWLRRFRYREDIGRVEDMDLWLRSYAESNLAKIPEPLLFYRLSTRYARRKWASTAWASSRVSMRSLAFGVTPHLGVAEWAKSVGKSVAYAVLPDRAWPLIRTRRIMAPESVQFDAWTSELASIANSVVPGWPRQSPSGREA